MFKPSSQTVAYILFLGNVVSSVNSDYYCGGRGPPAVGGT